MITFNCTIQEGIIPDDLRPTLAAELGRISTDILGGDAGDVDVQWTEVPHGFGFRGGELSTTSAVRGEIPPGCDSGNPCPADAINPGPLDGTDGMHHRRAGGIRPRPPVILTLLYTGPQWRHRRKHIKERIHAVLPLHHSQRRADL